VRPTSRSWIWLQSRIKKIEKHVRRQRAWLEAVDRASDANPITRRMDVNIDFSAAAHQLGKLEKDRDYALRVLAEAMIRSGQSPEVCARQRERIKTIDARLAILAPPAPQKKGLFSRLRGG
jgi:U3 small nucleolar ribonucleoprotein component